MCGLSCLEFLNVFAVAPSIRCANQPIGARAIRFNNQPSAYTHPSSSISVFAAITNGNSTQEKTCALWLKLTVNLQHSRVITFVVGTRLCKVFI
jgi:hypothetical protein